MLYCRECGREFETQKSLSGHIWNFHHITVKDYYDKYLKKFPDEGICICGNETTFLGTKYGYSKQGKENKQINKSSELIILRNQNR